MRFIYISTALLLMCFALFSKATNFNMQNMTLSSFIQGLEILAEGVDEKYYRELEQAQANNDAMFTDIEVETSGKDYILIMIIIFAGVGVIVMSFSTKHVHSKSQE
ncbi:MAG: hypothetical protein CFH44_00717 [Proteobacteria bacterium]|nr:MAG: hypothetical protein CFH44_00717 [Pseudomonadota bacterium]|tara:strand:- start:1023 stop:1340 length:318 start_codon:yes stop_codon:yes gene_type:complete